MALRRGVVVLKLALLCRFDVLYLGEAPGAGACPGRRRCPEHRVRALEPPRLVVGAGLLG